MDKDKVQEHIHRYFVAVYDEKYVYRAPETFLNTVERWMLAIAADQEASAEAEIVAIEEHMALKRSVPTDAKRYVDDFDR